MKNVVCDILGIRYPIIQGAMVHISTAELVAAVSNAGGLGQIAINLNVDSFRKEIQKTKELTDKPFGINIPLVINPKPYIDVAIEEGVKIISTSSGDPTLVAEYIKENKIVHCHVVPSVRLAVKSASVGVNIIIAEGCECGGHVSRDEVTTMALIPQVVQAVKVPVVAAGGIADGRGFVAAISLGAEGVQVGTRFAASKESITHMKYKEAILSAADIDTEIVARTTQPVRLLKNQLSKRIIGWEREGISGDELLNMIGSGVTFKALIDGDIQEGSPMAGQVAGLINEILSVEEIIQEIIYGGASVRERVHGYFDALKLTTHLCPEASK